MTQGKETLDARHASAPKRRAWPFGLLLAIAQVSFFTALPGSFGASLLGPVLLHLAELCVGIVWMRSKDREFYGRVLFFAVIFPMVLGAVLLLVVFAVCRANSDKPWI
ncbi:MAG TPA: hypothetical protein VFE33_24370 [Thermoanaerobaculia bacterium]|nr:hypothetical protein [Thermoanaerobaculia bacterium]